MTPLEAHYRQSLFIKDVTIERNHAIVVPDLAVLHAKKIVNVRELIRFELEGLSVSLPEHQRVTTFDVSMAGLPQAVAGPAEAASAVAFVRRHLGAGVDVHANSNLELDLGLDSVGRVELLAAIETHTGRALPEDLACAAFRVVDLAPAFARAGADAEGTTSSWAALLESAAEPPEMHDVLRRKPAGDALLFLVSRVIRLLARPRVTGLANLPAAAPFIVAPNHQSYVDPLVVASVLPFRVFRRLFFVGAIEYFETPLMRWLARQLNIVPVDPDAYLLSALKAAAWGLRHERVLLIFPEGERSIDGTVKVFKKGVAILSSHLGIPVVPVALDGMFEVWPRSRPFAWRRLLPWSGHRVEITCGPPVVLDDPSPAAGALRLRATVDQMLGGAKTRTTL